MGDHPNANHPDQSPPKWETNHAKNHPDEKAPPRQQTTFIRDHTLQQNSTEGYVPDEQQNMTHVHES